MFLNALLNSNKQPLNFFYLDGSQVILKIKTSIKPPPPTYYYKNNYYKNTKIPFVIDEEDLAF